MGDPASTLAFILEVNHNDGLQQAIRELPPKEWRLLRGIARDAGYDVDCTSFCEACLSEKVNYFCSALSAFAGPLHLYKM